jgi:hypothetical protein
MPDDRPVAPPLMLHRKIPLHLGGTPLRSRPTRVRAVPHRVLRPPGRRAAAGPAPDPHQTGQETDAIRRGRLRGGDHRRIRDAIHQPGPHLGQKVRQSCTAFDMIPRRHGIAGLQVAICMALQKHPEPDSIGIPADQDKAHIRQKRRRALPDESIRARWSRRPGPPPPFAAGRASSVAASAGCPVKRRSPAAVTRS